MDIHKSYFLSGVLLIDCPTFEQHQIFERVIQTITETTHHFFCPEQDAMNVCLSSDEHLPLSPQYNFCFCSPLLKKNFKKNSSPLIIHYAGHFLQKPWNLNKNIVRRSYQWHINRPIFYFSLLYWRYSDPISKSDYSTLSIISSLKSIQKALLQSVEHFFVRFFKKLKNKFLK